jgi:hypothetical protein
LILEEAEKFYNKLTTKLTNGIILASTTIRKSLLTLPPTNNSQN